MWAGGNVRWRSPLKVDGRRYACVEGIRDVTLKGKAGEEKVFVGIERRIGDASGVSSEEELRQKLWAEREEDFAGADVVERRNIVFMRERTEAELDKVRKRGAAPPKDKMLKRMSSPSFCTVRTSRHMLT
jgi:hydroxyacyl-ACP dehydratase HTD2-like protein with hotdog domain